VQLASLAWLVTDGSARLPRQRRSGELQAETTAACGAARPRVLDKTGRTGWPASTTLGGGCGGGDILGQRRVADLVCASDAGEVGNETSLVTSSLWTVVVLLTNAQTGQASRPNSPPLSIKEKRQTSWPELTTVQKRELGSIRLLSRPSLARTEPTKTRAEPESSVRTSRLSYNSPKDYSRLGVT